MSELNKMPNIGKVLSAKLISVGIENQSDLKSVGSKEAFLRILNIDPSACFSELSALEGAVQSIRWHYLDEATKSDLRSFFDSLK